MPNMESIIKRHNKKVLKGKPSNNINLCNSRKCDNCPLNRQCLTENVVYQAEIDVDELPMMTYIDSIEGVFK